MSISRPSTWLRKKKHNETEILKKGLLAMNDEYLTPKELIQRYKNAITLRTLANWRSTGEGPEYTKIGGRVLYALSRVMQWESKRTIRVASLVAFFIAMTAFSPQDGPGRWVSQIVHHHHASQTTV